jgi:purine-binding chemotaxis protein CheW
MAQATDVDATDATEQVLEFSLGEATYCVDIDYVTEIVDVGDLTPLPNAPPYVEGVMDLRGRTTAVVDPTVVFDVDGTAAGDRRIVVFDPAIIGDRKATGWLVDEVYKVVQVDPETVAEAADPGESPVRGVLGHDDDDEEFVIWVDPQAVHG